MSICPHCQAENASGATVCHTCGKALPAAADRDLPLWLQALKPDGSTEDIVVDAAHTPPPAPPHVESGGDMTTPVPADPTSAASAPDAVAAAPPRVAEAAPVEAPPSPAAANVAQPAAATRQPAARPGGADTVLDTQPTATVHSTTPAPASSATAETASLISEDDLPAWLRAFSEPTQDSEPAADDDQSWMVGDTTSAGAELGTNTLAQSWQAPPKIAASERASVTASNPVQAAKPERLITPIVPPPPAAQKTATAALATAPGGPAKPPPGTPVPVRLGSGRLSPAAPRRTSLAVQRVAIIAFLAALLIFLIVLGIFVVAPALRG